MGPYYPPYYYAATSGTNITTGWTVSGGAWVQPIVVGSDWEKAQVKAEPDDEFSWLRRSVKEVEDLAFAR